MDLSFGSEYDGFREEVKAFLKNNHDKAPKGRVIGESEAAQQSLDWQKLLIENGYTCRTIPKEYGGYGAEPNIIESRIIAEEFASAKVSQGLGGQTSGGGEHHKRHAQVCIQHGRLSCS